MNPISREHPGAVLFLLDQSASMLDPIPKPPGEASENGHAQPAKCQAAVDALNHAIHGLVRRSMKGEDLPRPYFSIGVIGYSDGLVNALPLSDSLLNPVATVAASTTELDARGVPIYVKPAGNSRTRMALALHAAGGALRPWADAHPASQPPIVINITDGLDNDPNPPKGQGPAYWARALTTAIETDFGSLTLINIVLPGAGKSSGRPALLPGHTGEIDADEGRAFFAMSSVLPDTMRDLVLERRPELELHPEARAFAFNVGIDDLAMMLDIGTRITTDLDLVSEAEPDPRRT